MKKMLAVAALVASLAMGVTTTLVGATDATPAAQAKAEASWSS